MATRYSGGLTVEVKWSDAHDAYAARVSGRGVGTSGAFFVGRPAAARGSVDSPDAYDAAAAAAISFSGLGDEAEWGSQSVLLRRSPRGPIVWGR